jgi:hypothetical protein
MVDAAIASNVPNTLYLSIEDFLLQARKPGALRQDANSRAWSVTSKPFERLKTAALAEVALGVASSVIAQPAHTQPGAGRGG